MKLLYLIISLFLISCATPEYNALTDALYEVKDPIIYSPVQTGRGLPTPVKNFTPVPEYTSPINTECVTFSIKLLQHLNNKGIDAKSVLVKEPIGNQEPEWNHMMVKSGVWYMDNNLSTPVLKEDLYGYRFKE